MRTVIFPENAKWHGHDAITRYIYVSQVRNTTIDGPVYFNSMYAAMQYADEYATFSANRIVLEAAKECLQIAIKGADHRQDGELASALSYSLKHIECFLDDVPPFCEQEAVGMCYNLCKTCPWHKNEN